MQHHVCNIVLRDIYNIYIGKREYNSKTNETNMLIYIKFTATHIKMKHINSICYLFITFTKYKEMYKNTFIWFQEMEKEK